MSSDRYKLVPIFPAKYPCTNQVPVMVATANELTRFPGTCRRDVGLVRDHLVTITVLQLIRYQAIISHSLQITPCLFRVLLSPVKQDIYCSCNFTLTTSYQISRYYPASHEGMCSINRPGIGSVATCVIGGGRRVWGPRRQESTWSRASSCH